MPDRGHSRWRRRSATASAALRNVSARVFQVTSPFSTEVSDYGEYNTSTVLKDVTGVVNVTFALRG